MTYKTIYPVFSFNYPLISFRYPVSSANYPVISFQYPVFSFQPCEAIQAVSSKGFEMANYVVFTLNYVVFTLCMR